MTQISWKNPDSGNWSDTGDWSTGTVPGGGDDVTIAANGSYAVTLRGHQAAHSLAIDQAGATLDLFGRLALGTTLTLTAGTLDLKDDGTIAGGTVVSDGGTFASGQGTLDGVAWEGPLTLDGGELFFANGFDVTGLDGTGPGIVELDGQAHIESNIDLVIQNATITLNNSGVAASSTLRLASDVTVDANGYSGLGASLLVNEGTINIGAGSFDNMSVDRFVNHGLLAADDIDGVIEIVGNVLNEGTISISTSDADVSVFSENAQLRNPGLISIGTGGRLFFRAQFNSETTAMTSQGTIDIASGGVLQLDGSDAPLAFTSTGSLTVDGTLFDGGNASLAHLDGTGTLDVESGSSLAFANMGGAAIGTTLINEGNVSMDSGGLQFLAAVANDGTIIDSAAMLFQRQLAGTGTLTLAAGATARLFDGAAKTQIVDLTGSGAALQLDNPLKFLGTIAGFGGNAEIDLRATAADSLNYSSGTLTASDGASTIADLKFAGSYTTSNFALSSDGAGGALITYQS